MSIHRGFLQGAAVDRRLLGSGRKTCPMACPSMAGRSFCKITLVRRALQLGQPMCWFGRIRRRYALYNPRCRAPEPGCQILVDFDDNVQFLGRWKRHGLEYALVDKGA